MKEKTEKLVACPISCSSNNDEYNDICKATGKPCPYFIDEGMSVCKRKIKCLTYFSKRLNEIHFGEVAKLIVSDTKSGKGKKSKYTNTIKHSKHMDRETAAESAEDAKEFMDGLEDALKNHRETTREDVQEETAAEIPMSAIERYKKK